MSSLGKSVAKSGLSDPHTIELTVRNLSLTIVPEEAQVTRLLQKAKSTLSKHYRQKYGSSEPRSDSGVDDGKDPFGRDERRGLNIFRNVSMTASPGQVCLIMGGSGSGKTTLLNAIAGRMNPSNTLIKGEIRLNGANAKKYRHSGQIGYLQQKDHLLPFVTVRETLQFAADLRLPSSMSKQNKAELVESLIMDLGLKECQNVIVGDPGGGEADQTGARGISGGERRRVSAAIQLLTRPSLLLCDEVTTGLDAFAAFELVKTLSSFAQSSQRTVVLSIHQPRSEIFQLLSKTGGQLILLSHGDVIYSGPLNGALPWLESVGMDPCPADMNPFDYILDLSMIDFASNKAETLSKARLDHLKTAWSQRLESQPLSNSSSSTLITTSSEDSNCALDIFKVAPSGLWCQTKTLTGRAWMNQVRNRHMLWGNLLSNLVMGLLLGFVFSNSDTTMTGIRSKAALCYCLTIFQPFVTMVVVVYKAAKDIKVFEREYHDRWYNAMAFMLSDFICHTPTNIIYPLVHVTTLWYVTDLRFGSNIQYLIIAGTYIISQFVRHVLGMACVAWVRDFDSASLLACAFHVIFCATGGFLTVASQIPVGLRWVAYISPARLAFRTTISAVFTDAHLGLGIEGNALLTTMFETPPHFYPAPMAQFLFHFGATSLFFWFCLTFVSSNPMASSSGHKSHMEVVFNIFVAPFVRQKAVPGQEAGGRKPGDGVVADISVAIPSEEKEATRVEIYGQGLRTRQPLTIRIEKLYLSVDVTKIQWSLAGLKTLVRRQRVQKTLLQEIDFVIPAGQLTAILGGSGSGKTSLLSTLLRRIPSDLHLSGNVYFNSTKNPSIRRINTVCGYVRQDDQYLLSHLTVRETLSFAAEMSMDRSRSKAEMLAKVDEIIDLIGLRECADVLVGDDTTSGCSGGQRRRVSIGLQLVIDPSGLFLDEPTSGLDALTALSIMHTLKAIAASGRTVVCAIHQPRYDIWNELDNVMLLITGGRLAYAGKKDGVLDHFIRAGHILPELTNPPDFIIDTASIDYRTPQLEAKTRATVEALADFYAKERASQSQASPHLPLGPEGVPDPMSEQLGNKVQHYAGFFQATHILTRKYFVDTFRQKSRYFNRVLEPTIVTLLTMTYFWRMDNTIAGLTSRLGALQMVNGGAIAAVMVSLDLFPRQRDIAFREISDGGYGASSFFMAFMINELPLTVLSSVITTTIIFVVAGFKATVFTVGCMYWVVFCYYILGESLGMICSAFLSRGGLDVVVMTAMSMWLAFLNGIFVQDLPLTLIWLNYLNPFRYGSIVIVRNELQGSTFQCTAAEIKRGVCLFSNGDQVLSFMGFLTHSVKMSLVYLTLTGLMVRLLALLALVLKAKLNGRRRHVP